MKKYQQIKILKKLLNVCDKNNLIESAILSPLASTSANLTIQTRLMRLT